MCDIDEVARLGYEFADNGCVGMPALNYGNEMEVMAFNAGISNYNAKNGTQRPKLKPLTATLCKATLDKNPYPAEHMAVQQASI